jgi:hypothetical protein
MKNHRSFFAFAITLAATLFLSASARAESLDGTYAYVNEAATTVGQLQIENCQVVSFQSWLPKKFRATQSKTPSLSLECDSTGALIPGGKIHADEVGNLIGLNPNFVAFRSQPSEPFEIEEGTLKTPNGRETHTFNRDCDAVIIEKNGRMKSTSELVCGYLATDPLTPIALYRNELQGTFCKAIVKLGKTEITCH